jgi:hypothetical protein
MENIMSTFREANQVRLMLKMKLSHYSWYNGSLVAPDADGFQVVIHASHIDNQVRKVVSPVVNGIGIKLEAN